MKKIKSRLLSLILLLSMPLLAIIYEWFNKPKGIVYSLVTNWDRNLPFVKIFVLPYASFQIFVLLTLCYFCFKDRKIYFTTLISVNISILICYFVYFVFQTVVPRPTVAGNDLLTKMLILVYRVDQPYNAFPSIHVLASFLMIKGISRSKIKNKLNYSIISIMAALIIVSTQFVKQHVLFDLISGILLGGLIFELVYILNSKKVLLWIYRNFSISYIYNKYLFLRNNIFQTNREG